MSVDLSEAVPLEVLLQVYDFLDPYTNGGKQTLKWLMAHEVAAGSEVLASRLMRKYARTDRCAKRESPIMMFALFLEIAGPAVRDFDEGKFMEVMECEFDVLLTTMMDNTNIADKIFSSKCVDTTKRVFDNSLKTRKLALARCLFRLMRTNFKLREDQKLLLLQISERHFHELIRDPVVVELYRGKSDQIVDSIHAALQKSSPNIIRVRHTVKSLLDMLEDSMTYQSLLRLYYK